MGRKQHQKDKMYITATEWATERGGKRKSTGVKGAEFRRLPFDCCAINLQPFEHPVCTPSGVSYDLLNIMPFLKQYGTDPTTGEKLDHKQLTRLHFHKNAEGKYHCPVTFKVFNENTKISAVRTTGNVYAHEALDTLNIKVKNWKDLLSDTPFTRKDIIQLQDPTDLEKFNLTKFHHLKKGLKVKDDVSDAEKLKPSYTLRNANAEASSTMSQLYASEGKWRKEHSKNVYGSKLSSTAKSAPSDAAHTAHYSTGEVSRSFTSTHMTIRTSNTAESIDSDLVRYSKIKKKGYVRLETNMGTLNLELRCDRVPKTCENFLKHCASGYYVGTIFHRSIRNFMIQGGDPTGTGKGGESAIDGGSPFADEFKPDLTHSGRGVLSMANSGPDSNKSQFFITYRSCNHLDKKHTVFGSLVGGMEALLKMERTEVDDKDRPLTEITIKDTKVFVDPFLDLVTEAKAEQEAKEAAALKKEAAQELDRVVAASTAAGGTGVGRYMKVQQTPAPATAAKTSTWESAREKRPAVMAPGTTASGTATGLAASLGLPSKKKAKVTGKGFGDFSAW